MVDLQVLAAFQRLVQGLAGPHALPAGGAAAVVAIAMGTALGAKVARMSAQEPATAELEALTRRITPEFEADCTAFEELLLAFESPRDASDRADRIGDRWRTATRVSVDVANLAAEAEHHLASLADGVKANLRGDLQAARTLVRAGWRIAASNADENAHHLDGTVAETILSDLPRPAD